MKRACVAAAADNAAVPGALWIVSAPSGGGKTSLCRALVPRLRARGIAAAISVSCTTRPPREGEREDIDYRFVDEARFAAMVEAGEFVEHAGVFGRHYGTLRAPLESTLRSGAVLLLDIDWQGGRQIRARYPEARSVFVLPPTIAVLEQRLRERAGSDASSVAARMRAARAEMAHYNEYDYVVVNSDFERAVGDFEALIVAETLRRNTQRLRHCALIDALLDDDGATTLE
ncbi:MAG TPA: guanylate kinase [Nevskiaceae bacterium]